MVALDGQMYVDLRLTIYITYFRSRQTMAANTLLQTRFCESPSHLFFTQYI